MGSRALWDAGRLTSSLLCSAGGYKCAIKSFIVKHFRIVRVDLESIMIQLRPLCSTLPSCIVCSSHFLEIFKSTWSAISILSVHTCSALIFVMERLGVLWPTECWCVAECACGSFWTKLSLCGCYDCRALELMTPVVSSSPVSLSNTVLSE